MRTTVALCFELNSCFLREIWRGVQEYGIGSKEWVLVCRPRLKKPSRFQKPSFDRKWLPHGLITHLTDHKRAKEWLSLGVPLVDTTFALSDLALTRVAVDEAALDRMAVAYFEAKGYRHYSYFYDNQFPDYPQRGAVLKSILRKSGHNYHSPPVRPPGDVLTKRFHPDVIKWLRSVPKPIAIFVHRDSVSAWLCDLCQQENLRVPEDVALLGIGNEEPFCMGCYPNLSSIELPGRKIGFEAARILAQMMNKRGRRILHSTKLIPPARVITRHSTDTYALESPVMATALHYIREHISEPFNVGDLVRASMVSRRLLEIACRTSTNRTLLEQIHYSRVERAKNLLASTALKITDVATGSGFSNSFHLRRIFAKYAGTKPAAYRKTVRVV